MLFYRSIGLLCVFITSLLYRTYKEMTRSMSLSPAAGAVFLIPLYKCGLLCHFSTCSPTRSWGVGSLSAQNAQQALACHALLHYFFVKCYNEVRAGTFCTHTEICCTIRRGKVCISAECHSCVGVVHFGREIYAKTNLVVT